jgi:hypothetical protein
LGVHHELCSGAAAACDAVTDLQAGIVFGSALTAEHPRDLDLALLWHPGFRNIIAHDYGVLDMQLVAKALHVDLVDLHELAKAMAIHALDDST